MEIEKVNILERFDWNQWNIDKIRQKHKELNLMSVKKYSLMTIKSF